MRSTGALIAFLAAVCSGSCSGTAASSRCVTGASIQCACNGGLAGAQVCGGDGAYSTCVCDPKDDVEPGAARDTSCAAVVAHMGRVNDPDGEDGEGDDEGLDVDDFLRQMCATWSEQMRRCVLGATGPADLEPCQQYLPEEMRGDDDDVDVREEVDDDIDED